MAKTKLELRPKFRGQSRWCVCRWPENIPGGWRPAGSNDCLPPPRYLRILDAERATWYAKHGQR